MSSEISLLNHELVHWAARGCGSTGRISKLCREVTDIPLDLAPEIV